MLLLQLPGCASTHFCQRFLVICCLLICLRTSVLANTPPRFTLGGVTDIVVRVKEGPESLGKLLYQLSADDADGDKLAFGVQGPVGPDFLRIESTGPKTADVYLRKELDREVADSYSIFLTLTDMKLPNGQFIIQPMLIIVDDINDNEPIFKPFRTTITVREDATPGKIESVEAVDRDAGPFGQVIYDIRDTDDDSDRTFTIETFGGLGIISLKGKLDYEKKSLYQLRVIATDLANNGRRNTGTAALLVKIEDIEDQPPVFVVVPSVTRVPEDLSVNSRVLAVKAIDGDRGVNNQITYRITKGGHGLFGISRTTGEVVVRGRLDREATDNRNGAFILEIQAEEISPNQYPPPSVTTEVTIILTDVNDETPQFRSRHYTAEINENAQINVPISFLGNSVPEVYDHDQGNNGTFKMFLEEDDGIFEVTPSEGVNEASFLIRVKRPTPIDYERTKVLNFKIVAREVVSLNPKSSTAEVTVYVRDINDNSPEFSQDIYRASIPENAKQGTTVVIIKAEDKDSGGFGTSGIRYTDIRGHIADKLHLDPISGAVTVRTNDHGFDRESASQYYVTIEARDNNGQGNRNSVQLMVILEDVNDNTPRFQQSKYEARINENQQSFSTPLVVQAQDDDLKGTDNSEIRYQIVSGDPDSNFTVNSMTGEIQPRYPLDFERIPQDTGDIRKFTLIVRAYDLGSPSLNSDVTVVIYVQDQNDHEPVFKRPFYSKAIQEDTPGGTSVLQVSAVDADQSPANSQVVYRIRAGAQDKFVIDADSGAVSVAEGANLDPDRTSPKTNVYLLEVLAMDGGFGDEKKQSSVLVNISVIDVNNKAPTFLSIVSPVTIREDALLGTHLTVVSAVDQDERPVLRYSIDYLTTEARNEDNVLVPASEFAYEGIFDISSVDGSITLVKKLDREKVESFKLVVKVEDTAGVTSGQSATASLTILVVDVNDNRPVFKKPYYQKAVPENSQTGVPVVTVTAEDADKNRTILYNLEGSNDQLPLLTIDSQSGEVFVNGRIDRETFTWLNLTVRATDNGVPALSSTSQLYVQILDENDNNPIFVEAPGEYLVAENAPVGKQVAVVVATDADQGDYGRITYLLDAASAKGKFRVDRDTGSLIVAEDLDRETTSVYSLIIQAWDNYQYGFPTGESRKTFKQITIRVTDVNDEAPVFVRQHMCATVTEFHRLGDTILMVSANDGDDPKTANGQVLFSIESGNEEGLFDIRNLERNTAKIVSRESLKTKVKNYTLALRAQDQGVPSRYADEAFKICISDVNDNPPVFIKPAQNFSIRIPENSTVGSVVVAVEARDADFGPNGEVRYRLKEMPNGHWRKFQVDSKSGTVTLKETLDRETQRIHEIRIEAFDLGHPTSLSAELEISVFVTDINDYAPEFTEDSYEVMFTENLGPGEETFKLIPTIDKDETDSALKPIPCYFIVGGNELGRFQLDIFTHHIYTTEILDREERSNYTLLIQASDDCFRVPSYVEKFDPRDNTLLQLRIGVRDQNDNPPRFTKKVFTGGVTTETDFGTVFTSVKAVDLDAGANSVVNYYLLGTVQRTLSEGLENLRGAPFAVDRKTGEVSLNFDPQKEMKGYFDFEVLANDTDGLSDKARVFVYLLREDQRVKFVLRLTPEELREKLEQFRDVLGNITGAIVNSDFYKYHENSDGSVDKKKTNLYLHFVNKDDNSIMEVNTVLELIDKNIDYLDELFKEFNVLYSEPAKVAVSGLSSEEQVRAWLIGVSVFLLVMLVLTISMCLTQRSRYERQLKAATATAFGSQDSALNRVDVPNTNQHSVEGSNPIWMHAYDNEWYKEDEEEQGPSSLDDNSLDENAVEIEANNAILQQQLAPTSNPHPLGLVPPPASVLQENSINAAFTFSAPTTIVSVNGKVTRPFSAGRPATLQRDHLTGGGLKKNRLISDTYRFTLPGGQKPAKRNITFPDLDPPLEEEVTTGEVIERVQEVMNGGSHLTEEQTSRENDLNRNYDENVFGPTKKEAFAQRITKLETSEL